MAKKLHALIVEMFLEMIVSFFEKQNCIFTDTCSTLFTAGKSATLTFTTENAFLTEETPVFYHKARRGFMNCASRTWQTIKAAASTQCFEASFLE